MGVVLILTAAEPMYVCVCHGVTDHQIRRAADEGVREAHELTMRTGAGSSCGSCVALAQQILDEQRNVRLLDIAILRAA